MIEKDQMQIPFRCVPTQIGPPAIDIADARAHHLGLLDRRLKN
jgi:hypothetical protein